MLLIEEAIATAIAVSALLHGWLIGPLIIWANHKWPDRMLSEGYYNPYFDGV